MAKRKPLKVIASSYDADGYAVAPVSAFREFEASDTFSAEHIGSGAVNDETFDFLANVTSDIQAQLDQGGDVSSVNGQTGIVVLDADDISDASTTNKYVTAAEKTKLSNLSGTNTGDQDLSSYFNKSADDTDDITEGATKKFATAAEKTKLGHISVTQAVDLDAIESASTTIPQNSKSAAYTTVLSDAGKHLLHPSADTTARIFTIDSNANVPYLVGTVITFINQNGGGVITIAITSDTMRLAGAGTTGSRSLAANGVATAIKITSTEWIISGVNLT